MRKKDFDKASFAEYRVSQLEDIIRKVVNDKAAEAVDSIMQSAATQSLFFRGDGLEEKVDEELIIVAIYRCLEGPAQRILLRNRARRH